MASERFESFSKFQTLNREKSIVTVKKLEGVKLVIWHWNIVPNHTFGQNINYSRKMANFLTFSKIQIFESTELCIFYNAFKFWDTFYIQNDGLAMDIPLSPFLTIMSEFEIHIISSFSWMYKSWNRYIDDFFLHCQRKTSGWLLKITQYSR